MNTRQPCSALPTRRAFTMIELLVVIAIIAILAAILFPVASAVREQARQSSSMGKLHGLYQAVRLYYEDEGRYPTSLFGYAEVEENGLRRPAQPFDLPNVVPMSQARGHFDVDPTVSRAPKQNGGYLYQEQLKSLETFQNSVSPVRDEKQVTGVYWPINTPISRLAGAFIDNNGVLRNGEVVRWMPETVGGASSCIPSGDADFPSIGYKEQPKLYYAMDSADIGPMLTKEGKPVIDPDGNTVYELHYSPDWTRQLGVICDLDAGYPVVTQLKYKNPPADRTVITYLTHHAAHAGSSNVLLLLLSGTVKKVNVKKAFDQLPLNYTP